MEFRTLDNYFAGNSFVRLGVDSYRQKRLMLNFLYYSGVRIGECLAVTIDDFHIHGYKGGFETGEIDVEFYIENAYSKSENDAYGYTLAR